MIGGDGTIRLQQCNCAIFGIASASTSPCDAELALFEEVLGAEVVRETHIACGRPLLHVPDLGDGRGLTAAASR